MRIGLVGVGRIGQFHASTVKSLPEVEAVVLADLDAELAASVAAGLGVQAASGVPEMLGQVDGVVITSGTGSHAPLIRTCVEAGLPTFCEKPIALDLQTNLDIVDVVEHTDVPVQLGFQRRFDVGYNRAKAALDAGDLGWLHQVRATTGDQAPPPAAFIKTSGGFFRDCTVHDADIIRYLTGREFVQVTALGSNRGADFFAEAGDCDSVAALATLDDGTLVTITGTRYNGGGHDVRLELLGSEGSIMVGLDDNFAMTSAEEGVDFPSGRRHWSFMERFQPAYVTELTAFCDVVAGRRENPCTARDAMEAFRVAEACDRSRREGRTVHLEEIAR
ncbi:MAG: Gfo/Idh/MocA family oxidoreductase [Actinomycetales bacterium]